MWNVAMIVGVIAYTFAFIAWFIFGFWRSKRWHEWVVVTLLTTGSVAMANAPIGAMVRNGLAQLDRAVAPIIGTWSGGTVVVVAGVLTFCVVVAGLAKKSIETWTVVAVIALPLLAGSIPGPMGGLIKWIVGIFAWVGSTVLSGLLGL